MGLQSGRRMDERLALLSADVETAMQKQNKGFDYKRFNVDQGLKDVKMYEWKPAGSRKPTLDALKLATARYLNDEVVQQQLKLCAQSLVRRRLERAVTRQWESFVSGTKYHCRYLGGSCDSAQGTLFADEDELLDHVQFVHRMDPPNERNLRDIAELLDRCRCH